MKTIKKLSNPQKFQAKELAVAYAALQEALAAPLDRRVAADWNKIVVWSWMLKERQEKIGIELVSPGTLDIIERHAREQRNLCETHDRAAEAA